jgi:hypothetical protein
MGYTAVGFWQQGVTSEPPEGGFAALWSVTGYESEFAAAGQSVDPVGFSWIDQDNSDGDLTPTIDVDPVNDPGRTFTQTADYAEGDFYGWSKCPVGTLSYAMPTTFDYDYTSKFRLSTNVGFSGMNFFSLLTGSNSNIELIISIETGGVLSLYLKGFGAALVGPVILTPGVDYEATMRFERNIDGVSYDLTLLLDGVIQGSSFNTLFADFDPSIGKLCPHPTNCDAFANVGATVRFYWSSLVEII